MSSIPSLIFDHWPISNCWQIKSCQGNNIWCTHFCLYSIALDWDITWRYTAIIGYDIASFLVVTVENRGRNNDIQLTSVNSPNWHLLRLQILWNDMWSDDSELLTCKFWNMYHSNTEPRMRLYWSVLVQCVNKDNQTLFLYLSYLHSRTHFDGFYVFRSTKNIFDRWSCVTYQKNFPTRGYTLQKTARRYDKNCAYGSDLESINGSITPCTCINGLVNKVE